MTISLTCACGARLEIDETFAGQTVNCPDCQRPIKTPRAERPGLQTSGFALVSLVLALVGAFTILGTLLAVVFGALGLRDIARRPEAVTGKGFAVTGIALGLVLTAVTAFALTSAELFGTPTNNLVSRFQWAGKLEYPEGDEVVRRVERFAIKRPEPRARWGVKRVEAADQFELQHAPSDLLMVNVDEDAHLLCYAEPGGRDDLKDCLDKVLEDFRKRDRAGIFTAGKPTSRSGTLTVIEPAVTLKPLGNLESRQVVVDKSLAGQRRRFIIRVVKSADDTDMYALIGGAHVGHFDQVKDALTKSMNSLRILDHDRAEP
jgi:hypothetical protein